MNDSYIYKFYIIYILNLRNNSTINKFYKKIKNLS